MKILIKLIFFSLLPNLFGIDDAVTIDKEQAQKAFSILQNIRSNPNSFFNELNFENDLKPSPVQLKWNDTLAKVAEAKAYDFN